MSVQVHIERLILDDVAIDRTDVAQLQAAIATALEQLVNRGGLHSELASGGALPRRVGGPLRITAGESVAQQAARIAQAIYGGIGA